jgi:hypothetical protein
MRQRSRGWIMPEADMLSMLRFIEEKIHSEAVETHYRDTLIRLQEILENDLNDIRLDSSSLEPANAQEEAA